MAVKPCWPAPKMRDFPRWELVLSQLRPKSPPKPQLLANPPAPAQASPTCVAVLGSETSEKSGGGKRVFPGAVDPVRAQQHWQNL